MTMRLAWWSLVTLEEGTVGKLLFVVGKLFLLDEIGLVVFGEYFYEGPFACTIACMT